MTFGLLGGATPKPTSGGGGGSTVITSDDVMSEIKEIKYTIWLDEYKSFGEESHVFNNKDNWAELMQSNAALNDSTMSTTAFNFLIENDIDPLTAMGNVYGTDIDFKQYNSFADIITNGDSILKILDHPVLSKLVSSYLPYNNELYSPSSAIWDIEDVSIINSLATRPGFLAYVKTLPLLSKSESVPSGYYFLEKINIEGRAYTTNSTQETYASLYSGCSGASYVNLEGSTVTVQAARNSSVGNFGYDNSVPGLGERTINKFVKSISLVNASALTQSYTTGVADPYNTTVHFKSTAYYRVIRP